MFRMPWIATILRTAGRLFGAIRRRWLGARRVLSTWRRFLVAHLARLRLALLSLLVRLWTLTSIWGPRAAALLLRSLAARSGRLYRLPWLPVTVIIWCIAISALWELTIGSAIYVAYYLSFVVIACASPKLGLCIAVFWLLTSLFEIAGSPSLPRDFALLALSFFAASAAVLRWRRLAPRPASWWPSDGQAAWITVLFLAFGWVSISIADWASETAIPNKPSPADRQQPQKASQVKIGLALSGGGYRAALFHAGVLSALEELKVPIEVVSSVSGASIIAAYYARGGTPQQFVDLVVGGHFNLEREALRINNVLCLITIPAGQGSFQVFPSSSQCSRTQLQANLLRRILLGDTLARDGSVDGRPELMLGITDILGARMLGVTPHGFVNIWLRPPLERLSFANPAMLGDAKHQAAFFPTRLAHLPEPQLLAELVAASGAFPGALPAYRLRAPYTVPGHAASTFSYLLADGGLTDNSGIVLLDAAQLLAREAKDYAANPFPERHQNPPTSWDISRWDVDLILASDGSALTPASVPSGAFDEFVRAIDVMNATTGGAEMFADRRQAEHPPVLLLSPRTLSPDPPRLTRGASGAFLQFGTPKDWGFDNGTDYDLPPLGFASLEQETLSLIIARMSPDMRAEAENILKHLVEAGTMTTEGVSVKAAFMDDGSLGAKAGSPLARLHELITLELDRRLAAFISTPTLRDQIDLDTATSIYTLGQEIVFLNRRYLACHLRRLELTKNAGEGKVAPKCRAFSGQVSARIISR